MPRSDIDAGRLWPSAGADGFTLANYRLTFDKLQGFDLYYRNSLLLAVGGTFLVLLAGSLAAFALARFRFLGNRLIFLIFLLTIMVPAEVTLMGQFDLLLATADGAPTASERLGHQEFILTYKSFEPIGPSCLPAR